MQGKVVPYCAWATVVSETVVVFTEPQYILLCVVDDCLVLITLHMQPP